MAPKIGEDTDVTISIKSLITIVSFTVTFVTAYLTMQEEIHVLQRDVAVLKDDMKEVQNVE